jgi:hypothetical protein
LAVLMGRQGPQLHPVVMTQPRRQVDLIDNMLREPPTAKSCGQRLSISPANTPQIYEQAQARTCAAAAWLSSREKPQRSVSKTMCMLEVCDSVLMGRHGPHHSPTGTSPTSRQPDELTNCVVGLSAWECCGRRLSISSNHHTPKCR